MNTEPQVRKRCDIVMKGGVTSGVVYPRAITRLAEHYDFVNIGGTSAGAIAAAIAAAAQFRRNTSGSESGFRELDQLPEELGLKVGRGGQTRLFSLFQPDDSTRRLFQVLTAGLGGGAGAVGRTVRAAFAEYPTWTSVGALPGLVLLGASAWHWGAGGIVWVWMAVAAGLALLGAFIGAAAGVVRDVLCELPLNHYGLCRGLGADTRDAEIPALTVWLEAYLRKTAGMEAAERPLTFGDLWGTRESDPEIAPRRINLEMMTSNVSHGRPYRLPFRDDADLHENHLFYFRPDEFRKLFPEAVVDWMVRNPRGHEDKPERIARRERLARLGYHPLPAPADLPVIVATRMSLSFPVLLGTVPLHWIHPGFRNGELPERCWFSDGGLCSNFPLHFFDAAVPRRPTFSIDLTEKPAGTPKAELGPEMDSTNNLPLQERWNRFDTETPFRPGLPPREKPVAARFPGFVMALIQTMQNWTDATQGRLPGFRDRIVRVPLTPDEGGLNLDMPKHLIEALTERGEQAADALLEHFHHPADGQVMTWDNHRWIRLRAYLAGQEKSLTQLLNAIDHAENGDRNYEQWLQDLIAAERDGEHAPSYLMNKVQLQSALDTLRALRAIRGQWPMYRASHRAPKPRAELRPRAQI